MECCSPCKKTAIFWFKNRGEQAVIPSNSISRYWVVITQYFNAWLFKWTSFFLKYALMWGILNGFIFKWINISYWIIRKRQGHGKWVHQRSLIYDNIHILTFFLVMYWYLHPHIYFQSVNFTVLIIWQCQELDTSYNDIHILIMTER